MGTERFAGREGGVKALDARRAPGLTRAQNGCGSLSFRRRKASLRPSSA